MMAMLPTLCSKMRLLVFQQAIWLLVISLSARVPRTRGFTIISSSSKRSLLAAGHRRHRRSHNEDVWSFSPRSQWSLLKKTCLHTTSSFSSEEQTGSFTTSRDNNNDDDDDDDNADTGQTFYVTFSSYRNNLEVLRRGDSVASEPLTIGDENHRFRVLLYPRGGGHSSSNTNSKKERDEEEGGFGMSYKVLPMALFDQAGDPKNDKLGVYLEYLGNDANNNNCVSSMVDATFTLRLKGKQSLSSKNNNNNPRFDVEWSAGMRFVTKGNGQLANGLASDFGAHLMQSQLLPTFLGLTDDDWNSNRNNNDQEQGNKKVDEDLDVEIRIKIHNSSPSSKEMLPSTSVDKDKNRKKGGIFSFEDIRKVGDMDDSNNKNDEVLLLEHDTEMVRVGKVVVPVLRSLSQRNRMFQEGVYPGVEYRIMRIFDMQNGGREVFGSVPGADYELKPVYPLVQQLERPWPVRVNEADIPRLFTAGMYNGVSALGSALTAVAGLTTAFLVSQLVSLFFIPSKSMDPTMQVGDVWVVEKVTPRFKSQKVGDVVLFSPPAALRNIVESNTSGGGRTLSDRDLFVKRVAAGPGDLVSVNQAGQVLVNQKPSPGKRDLCDEEPLRLIERYVKPTTKGKELQIMPNQVFVMGDCSSVSVDSRVWGPLDQSNIVGRPLFRIFPLNRIGGSLSLPTLNDFSEPTPTSIE